MSASAPATIRLATDADVELICVQRRAMFEDMGLEYRVGQRESITAFAEWVRPRIERGEYVGFIAERSGSAVAGAGLWFMEWPPTPQSLGTRRGYVLNVYTRPDSRGQGSRASSRGRSLATAPAAASRW